MSLSIPHIEEKMFLRSFMISKKLIFEHLRFQCFNTWLFYATKGVKSQLKFFCLRRKKII